MLNFSFGECLCVGVVALVVLGPQQLPVVAHWLGKLVKQLRLLTNIFKAEVDQLHQQQKLSANEQRAQTADEHYKNKS